MQKEASSAVSRGNKIVQNSERAAQAQMVLFSPSFELIMASTSRVMYWSEKLLKIIAEKISKKYGLMKLLRSSLFSCNTRKQDEMRTNSCQWKGLSPIKLVTIFIRGISFVCSRTHRKCPGGETGRRTGLKILSFLYRGVPVQVRPRAPNYLSN